VPLGLAARSPTMAWFADSAKKRLQISGFVQGKVFLMALHDFTNALDLL
jgi:hypothetical protein